jgi:hypothetical protein
MATTELQLPEVEALQDQPEVTVNDAFALIDSLMATTLDVDVSTNSGTAEDTDAVNTYLRFKLTGSPSGAVTLTVPDFGGARLFLVYNSTSKDATVRQTGSPGTTISVIAGAMVAIYADNLGSFNLRSLGLAGTPPVRTVAKQTFTAGSGTYTPTSGMLFCIVECQAGGGGGGGCAAPSAGNGAAGGGGGAGGFTRELFTAADIGASKGYVAGAGGAGGSAGNNAGTAGSDSTFGSTLLSAQGGALGAGGASIAGPVFIAGGAGGGVSTAGSLLARPGSAGRAGGVMAAGVSTIGGGGGDSYAGAGGAAGFVSAGGAGAGKGSGGGGGADVASGSSRAGGAGADGYVRVTEYVL